MLRSAFALALLILPLLANSTQAGPRARRNAFQPVYQPSPQYLPAGAVGEPVEALTALNEARVQRGLRPFIRDEGLMAGARACAVFRAARGIRDHTQNDFSFLPPGTSATCGGCGAAEASFGFMACEMWNPNFTHAGAVWVQGAGGLMYSHAFYGR